MIGPIQVSDANKWLKTPVHTEPDGTKREYTLMGVKADGAYIRLTYKTLVEQTELLYIFRTIEIYLNDMGREVLRTSSDFALPKELNPAPPSAPESPAVLPWGQWFKRALKLMFTGGNNATKSEVTRR